jgi:hypothetical protein
MSALHNCPDCTCGPPGEAFALRPATSSEWARRQAIEAAAEAVARVKEARKKPATTEKVEQEASCRWAHGPVDELDDRGLCRICAEDES